jgi:hypothetical protein
MLGTAACFALLEVLPIDFPYWAFGLLLLAMGLSMGGFSSPNRAGIMNSLPASDRGAGSGMNTTFQNSAQVLSIGIFFTLIIIGLAASLPASLSHGLTAHGVPSAAATRIAHLPPVSTLFAAFLGYNPVQHLVGASVLAHLTVAQRQALVGRDFFSTLIAVPFRQGLHAAFDFSILTCLLAAAASWSRGNQRSDGPADPQPTPGPGFAPDLGAAVSGARPTSPASELVRRP